MENCKYNHPIEEAFESTANKARDIPKQKHKTPELPYTTEHQTICSRLDGQEHEIMFGPQSGGLVPANPFASKAQQGYLHAHPEILGKDKLAEFDKATKGKKLPDKVK